MLGGRTQGILKFFQVLGLPRFHLRNDALIPFPGHLHHPLPGLDNSSCSRLAGGAAAPRDPWGCGCGSSGTCLGPVLTCTWDLGIWSCPVWTITTSKFSDSPQAALSPLMAFFSSNIKNSFPRIAHPHTSDETILSQWGKQGNKAQRDIKVRGLWNSGLGRTRKKSISRKM